MGRKWLGYIGWCVVLAAILSILSLTVIKSTTAMQQLSRTAVLQDDDPGSGHGPFKGKKKCFNLGKKKNCDCNRECMNGQKSKDQKCKNYCYEDECECKTKCDT